MTDVAVMLGANMTYAQKELEKSLDFEIQLAQVANNSSIKSYLD